MSPANRSFTINKRITVRPLMNKIVVGNSETCLEPRIMRLLLLLCSKPGEVLSKSLLIETIWASKRINEEGLTKAISVLRKTLQDPLLIKTVPKQGYSFEGEIEFVQTSKRSGFAPYLVQTAIALVSSLIVIVIFSFILLEQDTSQENGPSFEYTYMTNSKGLHLSPAISSTDLIAYVTRDEGDETFKLIVKSSKSEEIIYQSTNGVGDVGYPVFSPASNAVAFVAKKSGRTYLNVLTLANGKVETIYALGNMSISKVDWSPHGSLLVFSGKPNGAKYRKLFTYNFQTEEVVQLTDDEFNEFNPVFSSDGNRIAFLQSYPNGAQKSLSAYSLESGTVNTLREIGKQVYDHDWTDQDRGLLFTSRDHFGSFIHKLNLSTGDESLISNQNFSQLSVHGDKILASNYGSDSNLWMTSLNTSDAKSKPIVNSSRHELLAVLSPDNSSIAYISDRSGSYQVWQYGFENENSKQLTFLKDQLPYDKISWSPDSKSILVGIRDKERTKIVGISIENGQSETFLEDEHLNRFPDYQSFNKFHFISDRSGKKELWSFNIKTGEMKRLSHLKQAIDFAKIGEEGMLYFSKSKTKGIWKSTLAGENETRLIINDQNDYSNWELVGNSIYYLDRSTNPPTISILNTENNNLAVVQELLPDNQSWYTRFSVSADQSSVVYNQSDHYESDIVLLGEK